MKLNGKKATTFDSAILNDKNLCNKLKMLENSPKVDSSIMLLRQMKNNFYGR